MQALMRRVFEGSAQAKGSAQAERQSNETEHWKKAVPDLLKRLK